MKAMEIMKVYLVTTEPSNMYNVHICSHKGYHRKQRTLVLFPWKLPTKATNLSCFPYYNNHGSNQCYLYIQIIKMTFNGLKISKLKILRNLEVRIHYSFSREYRGWKNWLQSEFLPSFIFWVDKLISRKI